MERLTLSSALLLFATSALAGGNGGGPIIWRPVSASVPIDAPWVLGSMSLFLAIIAVRILRNRKG